MNKIKSLLGVPAPLYVGMLVYLPLSYMALGAPSQFMGFFVEEDRFYESVGALALLAASVLFAIAFWRARSKAYHLAIPKIKQAAYLGLALLFFVAFGEEISWGQRLIGFQTPDTVRAVNQQEEFNLHNLQALSKDGLLSQDRVLTGFAYGFMLLIPLAASLSKSARLVLERLVPFPPLSIGLLCVITYLATKVSEIVFAPGYTYTLVPFSQAVVEVKEANLELLFALSATFIARAMLQRPSQRADM